MTFIHKLTFHGINSLCEGKRGSTVQTRYLSWLAHHECIFVYRKATIFMKGTRKDINPASNSFKLESSGGIGVNSRPLAFDNNGMLPLHKAE